MNQNNGRADRVALVTGHVAGMIDLVALPVWVSTLIRFYDADARQAGALVTAYLAGVVVSCLLVAPRLRRASRLVPAAGFALAALVFLALGLQRMPFAAMAALHALAGLGAGTSLSVIHGRMGRTRNPHRMFSAAGLSLGVFSVVFLAAVPGFITPGHGAVLFLVFAAIVGLAALVTALGLKPEPDVAKQAAGPSALIGLRSPTRWLIAGMVCMTITQSTVFSFVERIGALRGFAPSMIEGVLIALGLVNLTPAVLAALLQGRVDSRRVTLAGPVVQAVLALVICFSTGFAPYAVATAIYVFVMIFTHTFVFGMMAAQDDSGRATALTPAILMTGSAVGPLLGGAVAVSFGLPAIAWVAVAVSAAGVASFALAGRRAPSAPLARPARPRHAG